MSFEAHSQINIFPKKISIILPFKNAGSSLYECISSIISQSFTCWELIAVDDHSVDDSKEIISKIILPESRIKYFKNPGIGIVDALNHGINMATSSIIARMDADDIMLSNRLESQFRLLKSHPDIGLVSCLVKHVQIEDHDTRGYQNYVTWINTITEPKDIYLNRFVESPFAHPSVMFRKELIKSYGGYRKGEFPEDYELWLRLLENNIKMIKINKILLEWRDTKTRLSRIDKRYNLNMFQRVKAIYLHNWLKFNISHQTPIHAWGAGKLAKKQIKHFENVNIFVKCIYDIDKKKTAKTSTSIPVLHYKKIPSPEKCFILVLLGRNNIRKKIESFLMIKGYKAGKNFLLLA